MTPTPLHHFFNNVTVRLSLYGWKLRLREGSEGYCWIHSKIIDIGIENANAKELILHEIAHISTCRFCNQKHNFDFWKLFEDLMRRFLPGVEISESMRFHRSYASVGMYGKDYETKSQSGPKKLYPYVYSS